jgi:hypothetical protein
VVRTTGPNYSKSSRCRDNGRSPSSISDQDERTLALAATAGEDVGSAPPCSVTVPGAGSGPSSEPAKVTRKANGFGVAVSIAIVTLWVFFQLAVRVKVVAGSGSGATVMLMFAALGGVGGVNCCKGEGDICGICSLLDGTGEIWRRDGSSKGSRWLVVIGLQVDEPAGRCRHAERIREGSRRQSRIDLGRRDQHRHRSGCGRDV